MRLGPSVMREVLPLLSGNHEPVREEAQRQEAVRKDPPFSGGGLTARVHHFPDLPDLAV